MTGPQRIDPDNPDKKVTAFIGRRCGNQRCCAALTHDESGRYTAALRRRSLMDGKGTSMTRLDVAELRASGHGVPGSPTRSNSSTRTLPTACRLQGVSIQSGIG